NPMKHSLIIMFAVASFFLFNSNSSCNETGKSASRENNNKYSASPETHKGDANAPHGIYVAADWDSPVPDYVLKNPDVEGVIIRIHWNKIQPEQGQYDWKFLNSETQRIVGAGKKVSVAIAAGKHSPDWIYSLGI